MSDAAARLLGQVPSLDALAQDPASARSRRAKPTRWRGGACCPPCGSVPSTCACALPSSTRGSGPAAREGSRAGYPRGILGPVAMTGAAFRRLRQRLGLTQAGLAARMGVHWNAVARWERGERPISELVARFARLLVATAGNRKPKVGRR